MRHHDAGLHLREHIRNCPSFLFVGLLNFPTLVVPQIGELAELSELAELLVRRPRVSKSEYSSDTELVRWVRDSHTACRVTKRDVTVGGCRGARPRVSEATAARTPPARAPMSPHERAPWPPFQCRGAVLG